MKKIFLIFIFCISLNLFSQSKNEVDTFRLDEAPQLNSIEWVSDSFFKSIKTFDFSNLKVFFPTFKTYKNIVKSSKGGDQTEYTQFLIYNSVWNKLRIQHQKLKKKFKALDIKPNKLKLDSFYFEKGKHQGLEFCYIYWIFTGKKDKQHIICALAIKHDHNWYIMDELKYVGIFIDPKKQKRVKKKKK